MFSIEEVREVFMAYASEAPALPSMVSERIDLGLVSYSLLWVESGH